MNARRPVAVVTEFRPGAEHPWLERIASDSAVHS